MPIEVKVSSSVHKFQPGCFYPLALSQDIADRLSRLIEINRWQRQLIQLESESDDDWAIADCRQQLNDSYDAFVETHGTIADHEPLLYFNKSIDPRLCVLTSLEDVTTDEVRKARIFFERILQYQPRHEGQLFDDEDLIERLQKAVFYAESERIGQELDMERVAELAGVAIEEAIELLTNAGIVFAIPEGFEDADQEED